MKGGGAPKNFEIFFQLKNFFGEIFFWVQKVDQEFWKVFPNLNIETHLVPVVGRTPVRAWYDQI